MILSQIPSVVEELPSTQPNAVLPRSARTPSPPPVLIDESSVDRAAAHLARRISTPRSARVIVNLAKGAKKSLYQDGLRKAQEEKGKRSEEAGKKPQIRLSLDRALIIDPDNAEDFLETRDAVISRKLRHKVASETWDRYKKELFELADTQYANESSDEDLVTSEASTVLEDGEAGDIEVPIATE